MEKVDQTSPGETKPVWVESGIKLADFRSSVDSSCSSLFPSPQKLLHTCTYAYMRITVKCRPHLWTVFSTHQACSDVQKCTPSSLLLNTSNFLCYLFAVGGSWEAHYGFTLRSGAKYGNLDGPFKCGREWHQSQANWTSDHPLSALIPIFVVSFSASFDISGLLPFWHHLYFLYS